MFAPWTFASPPPSPWLPMLAAHLPHICHMVIAQFFLPFRHCGVWYYIPHTTLSGTPLQGNSSRHPVGIALGIGSSPRKFLFGILVVHVVWPPVEKTNHSSLLWILSIDTRMKQSRKYEFNETLKHSSFMWKKFKCLERIETLIQMWF